MSASTTAQRPRRRDRMSWLVAAVVVLVLLAGAAVVWFESQARAQRVVPLWSDAVAATSQGPVAVPPGATASYLPDSRVLRPGPDASASDTDAAHTLAAEHSAWLASGDSPGAGTRYAELGRSALLDLKAMLLPDGPLPGEEAGVLAGVGRNPYGYVWPRDASFVAVALARTGHPDDAARVLRFLAGVQHPTDGFEARYRPDGSEVGDGRHPQTDGTGWALWAVAELVDAAGPGVVRDDPALLRLLDQATSHALTLTADGTQLPPVSSDYWEVRETHLTLGATAPILAGLEHASRAHAALGDAAMSARTAAAAKALTTEVERHFGSQGYPRHVTGGLSDAAVAFLLPPFLTEAPEGAGDAWRASVVRMLRPAGGLAPGGSWRDDGISWTPETALYALTAASIGDRTEAERWLDWLSTHRTSSGALPEKVLDDGSPASVAPLAWTAANVVLALTALD